MKLSKGGISIIVPVFNGAKFIENAYANIIDQQVSNFEILFIDNNSTDDSIEIIQKIIDKDDSVSLYKETTQGAAAARNKGLANAKGEFIHFFDVDDLLFEGALITLKNVLAENPEIASVFGNRVNSKNKNPNLKISIHNSNKVTIPPKQGLGLEWLKNKTNYLDLHLFCIEKLYLTQLKAFKKIYC